MITSENHCFRDELIRLIETRLPSEQEQRITDHLDQCDQCRDLLQELAGSPELWREANEVLSTCDRSLRQDADTWSRSHDSLSGNSPPANWVRRLLTPSERPELLGELNGRDVHEVIGQGGMGVVLKVWDPKLHRFLAAKMLSPMLASTGVARQRFFREAQSAAAVVHPNIVPIYDIQTDHAVPYILMPLVDGGSLQQRIEHDGPLPLVEVLAIGLQIAEALVAAHAQGLIHRDIKPANILLDSGGRRVLLSDFGLARTLDDASMTASGIISGTPHYMSPEQARGETLDPRSDLYGLGAVLFAMATGHPPVRGTSPLEVLRQVSEAPLLPASQINETLPPWFDQLLQQFLNKTADQRLDSAQHATELLRGCLAHLRAPARTALPDSVIPPSSRTFPFEMATWCLLATVAVLLGILIGWNPRLQTPVTQPTEQSDKVAAGDTLATTDNQGTPDTENPLVVNDNSEDLLNLDLQLDQQLYLINEQLKQLNQQMGIGTTEVQNRPPSLNLPLESSFNNRADQNEQLNQ